MSHQLKLCSGAVAVKKFKHAGWTVDRQVGSHVMLIKQGYLYQKLGLYNDYRISWAKAF